MPRLRSIVPLQQRIGPNAPTRRWLIASGAGAMRGAMATFLLGALIAMAYMRGYMGKGRVGTWARTWGLKGVLGSGFADAPPPPPQRNRSCRFFMDLPGYNWTHTMLHLVAHRSKWSVVRFEGPEQYPDSTFYKMSQRSLELFAFHYLFKHPWRTLTERDADIFYAPSSHTCNGLSHVRRDWRKISSEGHGCTDVTLGNRKKSVAAHGENKSFSIYTRPSWHVSRMFPLSAVCPNVNFSDGHMHSRSDPGPGFMCHITCTGIGA